MTGEIGLEGCSTGGGPVLFFNVARKNIRIEIISAMFYQLDNFMDYNKYYIRTTPLFKSMKRKPFMCLRCICELILQLFLSRGVSYLQELRVKIEKEKN